MSESPDTQAEAMCPGCPHPSHGDTDCGAVVGYDHLNGDHECGCPGIPSAEPDGEACNWPRCNSPKTGKCFAWCKCRCHSRRAKSAPAQDGAEVEALIWPVQRVLAQWIWEDADSPRLHGEALWKVAEQVQRMLAQRDKDPDAAVAAKVAEQIAQAADDDTALFADIERVCLSEPNGSAAADAIQDLFVAWLRAAALAGEQR